MRGAWEDGDHRAASGCSHASSSDCTRPASRVSSQPLSLEAESTTTSTVNKVCKYPQLWSIWTLIFLCKICRKNYNTPDGIRVYFVVSVTTLVRHCLAPRLPNILRLRSLSSGSDPGIARHYSHYSQAPGADHWGPGGDMVSVMRVITTLVTWRQGKLRGAAIMQRNL